jgi:hypothetical protein
MGVNFTNSNYYEISNDKQSIPASAAGTGTVITQGVAVVGTGTLFKTEMPAGSWLLDLANNELRKVVRCDSDTQATLDHAFTADLSSAAPDIIHEKYTNVVEISVIIPLVDSGSTPYAFGQINGVEFPSGLPYELSKASRDDSSIQDFINPIIADATGTVMKVSILS